MANWLDRLIGWISPEAGARREAWRSLMEDYRHYDAGDFRRGNAPWYATNQSADATDRYSRDTVRARARDLERNSDVMNSVIGPFVRNVVGQGLVLQATTENETLNQEIERLWRIWTKRRNCDVTQTQSLFQMLRMAVRRKKVDGGFFFVKVYTTGGLLPFKLQCLEVDELAGDMMRPNDPANRVVGGIEYNQYNAPVGYWFRRYDLDGMQARDPVFIPAERVIFYFSKRRPSQLREMSDMSQTATRIRDINEFMVAVSVKERIEACLSIFIKRAIPTAGLGRAGGPQPERHSYEGKTISPGMIHEMNVGDEIQVVNPQGQAADATSFVKLQQRMVGAGQGISYEATSRDMSEATYSSARQGILEDSMTYAEEDELLQDILDEIFETFVISAVLAGKLIIPDFWDRREEYFSHRFVKPPKGWIDPEREAGATQLALHSGQKTFKQVAAENGQDWRKQIDDICEVLEYARDMHGIDLGGVILGADPGTGAQQPADPPAAEGGGGSDPGDGDGEQTETETGND